MTEAEDKEKAEKLAAAKKRFEQLKKQKAGDKKKPAKKKTDKTEASASTEKQDEAEADTTTAQDDGKDTVETPAEKSAPNTDTKTDDRPAPARQTSLSLQSKERLESFRVASPTSGPLSPGAEAQDIYRKQAQRIEELEKANKKLSAEVEDAEASLEKAEEALENLREASGDVAELKSKADQAEARGEELEKLKAEIASLKRQNTQLASQAHKRRQSQSVSGPSASNDDLSSQLASKSATIESLELEISNLNNKLTSTTETSSEHLSRISTLENDLARTSRASEAATQELTELKQNLERASERAAQDGSSKASAETRIAQLESELSAARRAADEASKRAETLEKKVEALTSLHRESDARHQAKLRDAEKVEREAKELRSRIANLSNENATLKEARDRARKADMQGTDDDGIDELEDEEREKLRTRIRELEEENFELRRGVWRDKRRELQPGLDDHSTFDDVDLSSNSNARRPQGGHRGSSLQDVINSGISAFTGGNARRQSSGTGTKPGKQSLGLLDEDEDEFAFDEDAFRQAQEEEAKKRIERVKEIKRSLPAWKGWKIDLVDVRAGLGGVFDV